MQIPGTHNNPSQHALLLDETRTYRSLADKSSDFIGMCGLDFVPFYINPAGLDMVGLDMAQAEKTAVQDYFFEEDRAQIFNDFFPRIQRDGQSEIEIRFRHFKTGEALWVIYNVQALKDQQGKLIGYVTISRNIGDRKRTEDALRENEQMAKAMLEGSPDCVKLIDPHGQLIYMNPAGCQHMEIDDFNSRCAGKPWVGFWEGPDHGTAEAALEEARRRGETSRFEGFCPTMRKTPKWWEVSITPIRGSAGEILRFLCISRDITARRQSEIKRIEENEILDARRRTNEAFSFSKKLHDGVQAATDIATELTGAAFGAFFYNALDSMDMSYMLYTISGADKSLFDNFPMPRNTAIFAPTFAGSGAVRSDDITKDPRYGRNAPNHGMPSGHLPVCSYLAVPVKAESGEVLGGLFFGHPEAGIFTESKERLALAIARQASAGIENARAEQKIRSHQERINLALEASPLVGTWDWDIVNDRLIADERFAAIFAFDPVKAAAGTSITEFMKTIHPDDLPVVEKHLEYSLRTGAPFALDHRLRHADGSIRWINVRGRMHFNAEGKAVRMPGVMIDITTERKALEDLRESEQRWRLLTEAMPQLVWSCSADGFCRYLSSQWEEFTGVPTAELQGYKWLDLLHPDDRDRVASAWQAAVEDKADYKLEYRILRRDGYYHWFKTRGVPMRDENGRITTWYGTCTDIEDEKQAAEELRAIKEHQQLMLESARDFAIFSLDTQGSIVSWNPGAERIFGYGQEEMIGQPGSLVYVEEDRRNFIPEKEMAVAARDGRAEDERWHVRKDGGRLFLSGIMASMRDESGMLQGFTKIARDVTIQKEAEAKLVEARNLAEAANIAKTEFLANMSHEIRTPMNAVIGLSHILAMSKPLTERQQEYIKTLQLSADSLLALLNDLLDISKIEARTVELETIPFSLSEIMEEVISIMSVRAQEKGLYFDLDDQCIAGRTFIGDPARIRQIIMNLCSNAVKFTEKGGIRASVTCEDFHLLGMESICIRVADTGIGIASDKLSNIFDKFVQADSSISRKYGGTGLGLAITKTLAEIMGGSISVESEMGKGSAFTVRIPLQRGNRLNPAKQEQADKPASSAAPAAVRPRLLLVEDYSPNILVAGTYLQQFGYDYDVAVNGLEAIEKVKNNQYAAVLMDVQMHGMNGFEATRRIRDYERSRNAGALPIIGMTAHALSGDRERCLAAGMDDYISKPFDPTELEAMLSEAINDKVPATAS